MIDLNLKKNCREIAVLVVQDSGLVLIGGKMANGQQQQDHLE